VKWHQPTHSISDDFIEKGLRFAMAVGVVKSYGGSRQKGGHRRWHVDTSDGERYTWTPGQVVAFATGVRLVVERREGKA
jgi:hypothetical protein